MDREERARKLRAIVDELVGSGVSREDAETLVGNTVVHEFDVIEVPPTETGRRGARARRTFRERETLVYLQRVEQTVAAGLPREHAERLASHELSTEGDRGLPPELGQRDGDSGAD